MDIGSYPSQIFWLIITFGALYVFMWKIAIPQLRTTVEERKDKVSMDLNDAEQLKVKKTLIIGCQRLWQITINYRSISKYKFISTLQTQTL